VKICSPTFVGLRGVGGPRPPCTVTLVARRVSVGDQLPSVDVDENAPLESVNVRDLFKGKTGVLFAVPGAFTPTCSEKHLPGFIEEAESLTKAGAEIVACVSVNDAFVMKEWGKAKGAEGKVRMLADARCELTKALDMELDATPKLGNVRSQRYAMVVKDGEIKSIAKDDDSFAPEVIKALEAL